MGNEMDKIPLRLVLLNTVCTHPYDKRLAKGIILGAMSALNACGYSIEEAKEMISKLMPKNANQNCWPKTDK